MGTVLWNSLLSLVVLFLVLLLFCSSGADQVVTVDVHAARHLLRSGHRYLDVRTEEEFKKEHVENSENIPYMFNTPQGRVKNPKFMEQVSAAFGKEEKLVVGCQSGVRSLYATTDLLTVEFKHVSNMGGGYQAWVESGFAVNKPQDEL
ncbi:thiosulfate sulfurtransferase 18-like isoform X1 [Nicotiana tabacum]|uniref:Thiosulfate sulfurtransferase 18-like isoform X1 n=1 Tax=Nicotiana sylvestris TaxID=4096 RepID=A0A1U7V602_NICSY|nr:PREDICTED: thiosulfate sulfurtransferase 18-like isoform X1 [Nicotiana sylvestris]